MERNARFWTNDHNFDAPCKITLRYGQSLNLARGGPNSEGYHITYYSWDHQADHVLYTVSCRGRDCDGVYSSWQQLRCNLENLQTADGMPAWEPVDREELGATWES